MNTLLHHKTKEVSRRGLLSLLTCPLLVQAAPQGAQVVSGQAVVMHSQARPAKAYASGSNQARLADAGLSLSWEGPGHCGAPA